MYKSLIRPLLFKFDPEKIHYFTTGLLHSILNIPIISSIYKSNYTLENKKLEKNVFDIVFKNPIGLAAGFDKNAEFYKDMNELGFGFIEIGTVTPKPQDGNPKKRMFRLREDEALINRMGFNNKGIEAVVKNLRNKGDITIGGNIGKNKTTPNENAVEDYDICFNALFDYVDYFVVNVSSPNTPNLRALQDKKPLTKILQHLQNVNNNKDQPKPILLKIAPDLSDAQLTDIIEIVENTGIAGVIATNTTIQRDGLISKNKAESGGLSGKPLKNRSTEVIRFLKQNAKKPFPIIGVGGIHSSKDAMEKFEAGADLIQLYTGFVYEGPQLIKDIKKALLVSS